MRAKGDNDFIVTVEKVGQFTFARRTLRDETKIMCEHARITECIVNPPPALDMVATWLACLRVSMVEAPNGFDLDTIDPFDDEQYEKLRAIYQEVMADEARFRKKSGKGSKAASKDNKTDEGVLVSSEVQPTAD